MLHRHSRGRVEPWSTGSAEFFIGHEERGWPMPVAVWCRLGDHENVLALLDTGSQWSILGGDTARLLEDHLEDLGIPVTMETRLGSHPGTLHRLPMALIASEGADLGCDATVLVLPGWPGPVVLGFRGFLERVRIALDPEDHGALFYFGPRA